ncbi:MAG: metalloregulator ArsR/SmtB family transcription factor [Fusobacteria bacterium]|nr:metalloregulator ArsR/SmtB family transcription factor [Fusobacteriota bacterium]
MTIERAELIFKMLSNEIRIKILKILVSQGTTGICVSGMEDIIKCKQSSVSQHLAHLRNSGIITAEKKGTKVCYKLVDEDVLKIISSIEIENIV